MEPKCEANFQNNSTEYQNYLKVDYKYYFNRFVQKECMTAQYMYMNYLKIFDLCFFAMIQEYKHESNI